MRKSKPTSRPPRPPQLELVKQYTPLVRQIAGGIKRKVPSNVRLDDLVAAGMAGLWDGIRRNAATSASDTFEWYIRTRVRGAILDQLRAQDDLPRRARAIAEATRGTSAYFPPPTIIRFGDLTDWQQNQALSQVSDSEAEIDRKEQADGLLEVIARLPDRERRIISQHYFRGVKFKDLGKELGVTEPRISQLHARAIGRLRLALTGVATIPKPKPKPKPKATSKRRRKRNR